MASPQDVRLHALEVRVLELEQRVATMERASRRVPPSFVSREEWVAAVDLFKDKSRYACARFLGYDFKTVKKYMQMHNIKDPWEIPKVTR